MYHSTVSSTLFLMVSFGVHLSIFFALELDANNLLTSLLFALTLFLSMTTSNLYPKSFFKIFNILFIETSKLLPRLIVSPEILLFFIVVI